MNFKTTACLAIITLFTSFNIFADEIYQESAANLCKQLSQKSYTTKCMAQIKKATFNNEAVAFCGKQKTWGKIKKCLPLIQNTNFDAAPLAICSTVKYVNNDLKKCLKEIANKTYVSAIEVDMCAQEKYYAKQVKCLKTATSKPFEVPSQANQPDTSVALLELQEKITKAYDLMRENKTTDATILLHDLVKDFEKSKI
ncbi:MAG: hypothetical protein V7785_13505 [Bermanella sp.]